MFRSVHAGTFLGSVCVLADNKSLVCVFDVPSLVFDVVSGSILCQWLSFLWREVSVGTLGAATATGRHGILRFRADKYWQTSKVFQPMVFIPEHKLQMDSVGNAQTAAKVLNELIIDHWSHIRKSGNNKANKTKLLRLLFHLVSTHALVPTRMRLLDLKGVLILSNNNKFSCWGTQLSFLTVSSYMEKDFKAFFPLFSA